ncbi:hypothetical protein ACFX2A_009625 [Malus domestica]
MGYTISRTNFLSGGGCASAKYSVKCSYKLVWHLEKNGKFSVKSVYHIARKDCEIIGITAESSGAQKRDLVLWKKLWSTCVPPKVKICVWRGFLDALPTR